jgi:hypothetical protein
LGGANNRPAIRTAEENFQALEVSAIRAPHSEHWEAITWIKLKAEIKKWECLGIPFFAILYEIHSSPGPLGSTQIAPNFASPCNDIFKPIPFRNIESFGFSVGEMIWI